jgi:alpha-L-fucosidase
MNYKRANTDWLAACRYGIGFHWTTETTPRHGQPLDFQRAVSQFRLKEFIGAIEESGADCVIFTATHAMQMWPCPHPIVDGILPGRTCERDLLGEIADALARAGKHFIVYYNHSCNFGADSAWEKAIGYHDPSKERLAANHCDIVRWVGDRYGEKFSGWWFDSSSALDPSGPRNSVRTDMTGFRFPWEKLTEAAKAGHGDRLVTYNAGVNQTYQYTTHQDYWSGELVDLKHRPSGRFLSDGRQWSAYMVLDDRGWIHVRPETDAADPLYTDLELSSFVAHCVRQQAPVCFNVEIFQDGTVSAKAIRQLSRLGKNLKLEDSLFLQPRKP